MALIEAVREREFLNRLNWSVLSCHDKALAVAAEAIQENASLLFVLQKFAGRDNLLTDSNMGIGSDSYYAYIGRSCGIKFQRMYGKADRLLAQLQALADSGSVAVFMVNTKYQTGARMAGKKDHPHFMVYKGYDQEGYHFIDEDWSKEYWKIRDTETDVHYVERALGFEELEALACGISSCNIFSSDADAQAFGEEKYFAYYLVTGDGDNPLSLEQIGQSFRSSMRSYLDSRDAHLEYILKQMDHFRNQLVSRKEKMIAEVNSRLVPDEREKDRASMKEQEFRARQDAIFAVRNRFIYPCESELIGAHADFLYSIKRVMELRSSAFPGKEELLRSFGNLLQEYAKIKMLISRGVILADKQLVDDALVRFTDVFAAECLAYENLINYEWELTTL